MSESARQGKAKNKGGGSKRQIGEKAMCTYLDGLRAGARHEDAARAAGFSRSAFYWLRKSDADFSRLCDDAVSFSSGARYVSPGAGRKIQLRRNRKVRFDEARKAIFRDRFAATCNLSAAAEAAGVSQSTVFAHIAKDPDFAAQCREDLQVGYVRLEAEIVRRRLKAQKRLRKVKPTGEPEPEFERAMKLLQRWDRRDGSIGPRSVAHGRRQRWTFEEAIAALDKKLKAVNIPILGEGDEEAAPDRTGSPPDANGPSPDGDGPSPDGDGSAPDGDGEA